MARPARGARAAEVAEAHEVDEAMAALPLLKVVLKPGDVIATGTPNGAGARFDPPKYLRDGDLVAAAGPETTVSIGAPAHVHADVAAGDVVRVLGQFEGRRVRVSYLRGAKEQTAPLGRIDKDVFDPDDYKLSAIRPRHFAPLMGPEVKKGPLVAVAAIVYADGSDREIIRESFFFEP